MGLRFRKSIKICKGVSINLGAKGASLSLGKHGARYTIGTSGRRTATVGIPGTGLSYSKSFSNSKKKNTDAKSSKKTQITSDTAQKAVDEQREYLERIRKIHTVCDEPVDWTALATALPPFEYGTQGPLAAQAAKDYENFRPKFSERLFRKKGEARKQALFDAIQTAAAKDADQYNDWKDGKEFALSILNGDTDAYLEAIEEGNPFADFAEYGSDFEFGTEQPGCIEVEFDVKSEGVVPQKIKSLTPTGRLSQKDITKTQFFDYTQDFVCSTAIRLARELFALLPVETVLVHAVDQVLNTATGLENEVTILSVEFIRSRFCNINFEQIDCSDFVNTFRHNMDFAKTAGFREVEPLT